MSDAFIRRKGETMRQFLGRLIHIASQRDQRVGSGDVYDFAMTVARIAYRAGLVAGRDRR